MVFPFEKFLTDNLKTYGLMDPVNFLENVFIDILKISCQQCPFLLQQMFFLISRINPVFHRRLQGDYSNFKHFKKCNGTVGSTIKKLLII